MIGRTIGNYVVTQKIGEGGMGAVFLAEHPRIKRMVAIKVLLPEFGKNPQAVARFFTEARAANEIHNEHIIDIIDFGELDDGASYIIMEYLDGKSLADVLEKEGRMTLTRAIHITRGIGRALAAAHAHGIVHRDLKPDNIYLLTRGGDDSFVKVLDFGIAKLMPNGLSAGTDVKTQTGALIGTPLYMSPEQCRGVAIDHRADIYSLGVILYQMTTGRLPFNCEGLGQLLLMHMTEPPPPPRSIDASIPPFVESAILQALQKDPENRYARVEAFLNALSDVNTGSMAVMDPQDSGAISISARPEDPTRQIAATAQPTEIIAARGDTLGGVALETAVVEPPKRRSTLVVAGASLGILAVIAVVMVARPSQKNEPLVPETSPSAATVAAAGVPSPSPSPPLPIPAAQPTLPQPLAPVSAKVYVKATPAEAQISLDDAAINNPFEGSFPRNDTRHRLVVKLKGYRTESSWVSFEEDRDIEIKLVRGAGTHEIATKGTQVAKPAHSATPVTAPPVPKEPDPPSTTYKGTKGKLITTFPE